MLVPKINFLKPSAPLEFVKALHETGFAVLTHHPIPKALIDSAFEEWSAFFRSEEKKLWKYNEESQAGYFPFKSEKAKDQSLFDLKEFFHYYPTRTALPPHAQSATPQLYSHLLPLAQTLLSWIDDHSPQAIKEHFLETLKSMMANSQETLLRPIHYPPLDSLSPDRASGAIRAAAHEDINLITLLPAATAPGLEVRDTEGVWHKVSCDPGELAINAGDMLQMASHGYYRSTTHRVVNPSGPLALEPRYSMPLFLHPRSDARLSDSYTSGQYLRERLSQIGLLKASQGTPPPSGAIPKESRPGT